MIHKIRVILDVEEDVFRDIEILGTDNLHNLHQTIKQAFGFMDAELASFYRSDSDWEQGEEIPLEDFSDDQSSITMFDIAIQDALPEAKSKLLYVYDFFKMYSFYVEALELKEESKSAEYPIISFVFGELPESLSEHLPNITLNEDDFLDDDIFGGHENIDELDI